MLGFGAPPVLGGPAVQGVNDFLGDVSDEELGHGLPPHVNALAVASGSGRTTEALHEPESREDE